MNTKQIKKNIANLLNVKTSDLSVKMVKVSFQNYSQVTIQSRTVNLWQVEKQVQCMYPTYSASSTSYATL